MKLRARHAVRGLVDPTDCINGRGCFFSPTLRDQPFRRLAHPEREGAKDGHDKAQNSQDDVDVSPSHVVGFPACRWRGTLWAAKVYHEWPSFPRQFWSVRLLTSRVVEDSIRRQKF